MAYRMSSSSICTHFTQNAWKKDLCSNCFKSKDEHKQAQSHAQSTASRFTASVLATSTKVTSSLLHKMEIDNKKTDYPNKHKSPAKSIIKKSTNTTTTKSNGKRNKVSFPKNLFEVIGFGGEWSDNSDDGDDDDDDNNNDYDDDHDFMNIDNEHDDNAARNTDDEETLELKRITRANTDFNMNNGNLLGDAQENIKKSFAALKLGAPQVDKEGKKQTLKINVVPFGAAESKESAQIKQKTTITAASVKAKFETKTETEAAVGKVETLTATNKQSLTSVKSSKKTLPTLTISSSTATATATTTKTSSMTTTTKTATTNYSTSKSTLLQNGSKQDTANSSDSDGKNSPPIERAMEKSLLDEISETLEQKKSESKKLVSERPSQQSPVTTPTTPSKIKFEITSLSESLEQKTTPFLDLKKPIARNTPISKDQAKPKINVFNKYSDSESNSSDAENGVSAYYDVVETQISYENLPDGKCNPSESKPTTSAKKSQADNKDVFSSSQYITDMLLSSKTRAASYNLHEGNFMTSKITSDGLIVTKCSSDDALDSTGSSFDGSSDEETSYNMIRSESDSGIGISIGSEYKNINAIEKERERVRVEKKLSVSTNNSDYEDIQIADQKPVVKRLEVNSSTKKLAPILAKSNFSLEKRRELHGEPDGSADPDGSLENKDPLTQQLPALPKSPPPTKIDSRPSFLHGVQKQQTLLLKKPELPVKPVVSPVSSPLKTFIAGKRQPTNMEQQVINQLQMVISKSGENLNAESTASKDDAKLKKGRAPNPPPEQNQKSSAPPTPERDYNIGMDFEDRTERESKKETTSTEDTRPSMKIEQQQQHQQHQETIKRTNEIEAPNKSSQHVKTEVETTTATKTTTSTTKFVGTTSSNNNLYTRKPPAQSNNSVTSNHNHNSSSSASPVIREKDKRERATINPKFRSLNTFVTQRNNAAKNLQLQEATTSYNLKQSLTPEPTPRSPKTKNFSVSEECLTAAQLNAAAAATSNSMANLASLTPEKKSSGQSVKQKTKFSIKKFLRMGTNKTADNLSKKDGIYSEICTGEESGVVGKPRLVIIHPIDINPTAVEVVKDITKTSDPVTAQTVCVLTAKPPAPPMRNVDSQRTLEINKPARPPPPKSAELRRKQKQFSLSAATGSSLALAACSVDSAGGSLKSKADNVYANLGEIRSAIAPRKPERTASMREREAQLELVRKRHASSSGTKNNDNTDTISICSSNGDIVSSSEPSGSSTATSNQKSSNNSSNNESKQTGTPGTRSGTTFDRSKSMPSEVKPNVVSKLEIFENRNSTTSSYGTEGRPSSLKDSVRKINSTIDSYLKDKRDYENMYELIKASTSTSTSQSQSQPTSPPPPPARTMDLSSVTGQRLIPPRRNNQLYSDTVSVASFTRSEYGATTRAYGLNSNSMANIPRGISASYCGSEVGEFEIYSPYSYYGSEAGGDLAADINDSVWGIPSAAKNRVKATNRLRMRKGRSVVHKSIEDNYTAVVVANHEALAQVLEQLQQTPIIPPALRPLANAINLRFEDFSILDGAQAFVVGKKAFHAAVWTSAPVTLALSADCNQLSGVGGELNQLSGGISGVLNPITEFCDLVPSYHLPLMPSTEVTLMQATISVLPRLQLDTLQSIGTILKGKSQVLDKSNFNFRGSIPNLSGLKDITGGSNTLRNVVSVQNLSTLNEESSEKLTQQQNDGESNQTANNSQLGVPAFDDVMTREVAFIMLQLVNGMKNLQVKAVEEMPLSLSNVVLSKDVENKDSQARLCVLQGNHNDEEEPMGTLCKCAHIALTEMLPLTKITPILADILLQERAESLSKAKSVLEFVLWGPSDVVLTGSIKERELALQRWLDLERATVLHGLVRTRIELTVYDECHLMFLVRSTAKMMNDAAKIVFSYQQQQNPAA